MCHIYYAIWKLLNVLHFWQAYTNRNRRKRLRRKKAQPIRSSIIEKEPYANSFKDQSVIPLTTPPPALSLSSLSLKPQWLKGSNSYTSYLRSQSSPTEVKKETSITQNAVEFVQNSLGTTSVDKFEREASLSSEKFVGKSEKEKLHDLEAKVRNSALLTINAVVDVSLKSVQLKFALNWKKWSFLYIINLNMIIIYCISVITFSLWLLAHVKPSSYLILFFILFSACIMKPDFLKMFLNIRILHLCFTFFVVSNIYLNSNL